MREGARADVGDTVKRAILGSEREPTVPADLRVALTDDHAHRSSRLDPLDHSAKKPETRARRVKRTVEQLSSGKPRPCCVNVFEFMLGRVQEREEPEDGELRPPVKDKGK